MKRLWLLVILMVSARVPQAVGATHYVSRGGTNNAPYLTWADAATNIQYALNAATNGETVLVSNATYNLSAALTISNNITIRSYNAGSVDPDNTIINGNYPNYTNRCIYMTNTAPWLEGFTITNGFTNGNGGGIYMTGGTVTNCIIQYNVTTNNGGGISMSGGLIAFCAISGNSSSNGRGGVNMTGGTLSNCTISANSTTNGAGAGIYQSGGSVLSCLISCNTNVTSGMAEGGGMYLSGSSTIV